MGEAVGTGCRPGMNDLDEAFAQVRAAYSVVWAYQRRLFDVFDSVDRGVSPLGFQFRDWRPWRARPPARSSTRFFRPGAWAWDMLPAYAMKLRWLRDLPEGERQLRLVLWSEADSAFDPSGSGEPDPAQWSDRESRSLLWAYLWSGPLRGAAWGEAVAWADGLPDTKPAEVSIGGCRYELEVVRLDLAELESAARVESELIQPIGEWFRRKRNATQ